MAKKLIGELSIPDKYTINQTIVSTSWDDIEGKPEFVKPPLIIEMVYMSDLGHFQYSGATYDEIVQAYEDNRDIRANVHRASWIDTYGPIQIQLAGIAADGRLLFQGMFNSVSDNDSFTLIQMWIYENGYYDDEIGVDSRFMDVAGNQLAHSIFDIQIDADKNVTDSDFDFYSFFNAINQGVNMPVLRVWLHEFGGGFIILPQFTEFQNNSVGMFSCSFYQGKWYDFNITIDVDNNVLDVVYAPRESGSSGPENYLVSASIEGNKLSLTPNEGQPLEFTVIGNYNFSSTQTFTDDEKLIIRDAYNGKINISINRVSVIRIFSYPGDRWAFVVLNTNGATENQVLIYVVSHDANQNVTSNSFSLLMSYYLLGSSSQLTGNILTSDNYNDYITIPGEWIEATTSSDSNLANAKELGILFSDTNNHKIFQYYNFSLTQTGLSGTLLDYAYENFYLCTPAVSTFMSYNGVEIMASGIEIVKIYYKT